MECEHKHIECVRAHTSQGPRNCLSEIRDRLPFHLSAPIFPHTQDHVALFDLALDDEDQGRIDEVGVAGPGGRQHAASCGHMQPHSCSPTLTPLMQPYPDLVSMQVLSRGRRPKGDCYQWERGEGAF